MGKTSLEAVASRGMRRSVQFGFLETKGAARRVAMMMMMMMMAVVRDFQGEEIECKEDILATVR